VVIAAGSALAAGTFRQAVLVNAAAGPLVVTVPLAAALLVPVAREVLPAWEAAVAVLVVAVEAAVSVVAAVCAVAVAVAAAVGSRDTVRKCRRNKQ